MQINSFLVKRLKLSHAEVYAIIQNGHVYIDDLPAFQKQLITLQQTIIYNNIVLQKAKPLFYYAYNKPVGVESSLNLAISNNLIIATGIEDYFFPIGRLDKASEGLMILTNDGHLYKEIIAVDSTIKKVYEVEVGQEISEEFLTKMSAGVMIMGTYTKSCEIIKIDNFRFKITLIEGRNRQIRRMCYKLGYDILSLKRVAIAKLNLADLKNGTTIKIERNSIL